MVGGGGRGRSGEEDGGGVKIMRERGRGSFPE